MKYKVHFYRKSGEGEQIIYLMCSVMGNRLKASVKVKVDSKMWSSKSESCIESSTFSREENRYSRRTNKYLRYIRKKMDEHINSVYFGKASDVDLSIYTHYLSILINRYGKKEEEETKKRTLTPLEFFAACIENKKKEINKRTGTFVSSGTVTNHECVLKRYRSYISSNHYTDRWSLFNNTFNNDFTAWLSNQNYTLNTVVQTNSILKIWLNQAVANGLLTDTSYKDLITKNETVEHVYLNENELKKLYDLDFSVYAPAVINSAEKKNLEEVRDLFIVGSQTGLRFSDLNLLNNANFDLESRTVTVRQRKTQGIIVIPLSSLMLELYKKYNGIFPRIKEKSSFNRRIQKCAKLAGIDEVINISENKGGKILATQKLKYELIGSHTARRSFATNLYLKCHNSRLVMSFTGHTTEENFKKYICLSAMDYVEEGRRFFD